VLFSFQTAAFRPDATPHLIPNCYLCGDRTGRYLPVCQGCEADLPWNDQSCEICDLPMMNSGQVCDSCFLEPFSADRIFSAFQYRYPIDSLIRNFKYSNKRHLGRLLTQLLYSRYLLKKDREILLKKADLIIPMPISPQRYRDRGFNQASDIALWLGKQMQIPVMLNGIKRHHWDRHQASSTRQERKNNLSGIFEVRKKQVKHESTVIIVDDVITTGASIDSVALALKSVGVKKVVAVSLARTPKN